MKSTELRSFIEEIKFRNRNPKDNSVLYLLNDLDTNPEIVIDTDTFLFRSRLVDDTMESDTDKGFYGYDAKNSLAPEPKKTVDGRANYRNIPYLYCSNDEYISMIEVRPRFSARVSVVTIAVKEKITLLDFTMQTIPKNMSEEKKTLFYDLSELFSTPIANSDDVLEYIPTQYIAEYVKNLPYDGIAFKSSLLTESLGAGKPLGEINIVVFNHEKCVAKASNVYKITENYLECEQVDQDKLRKEIVSPVIKALQSV